MEGDGEAGGDMSGADTFSSLYQLPTRHLVVEVDDHFDEQANSPPLLYKSIYPLERESNLYSKERPHAV